MNREIKFRAWSTFRNKEELIYLNKFTSKDLESCDNWKVMQYTSLKDKNGKMIFEGDVIQKDDYKYLVDYIDGGFGGTWLEDDGVFYSFIHPFFEAKKCVVIGNIYENPELLKGE